MNKEKVVSPRRRSLLTLGAASAGLLGLGGKPASGAMAAPGANSRYFDQLSLALLRDYRTAKASSYDRSGGNADWRRLEPGQTLTLLESTGPGMVSHIWFTIASSDPQHLKRIILRMFWDGEKEPSVEVPVGDFFGLNLGEYFLYESALLSVAPVKALNAYFPMPFRKSALITATSESERPVDAFYWNIDYQMLPDLPENVGYFHSQYRQSAPCPGWKTAVEKNPDGKDNYVFMEATGRGHLVGVTQGMVLNQDGWWGEGDDMLFVDGSEKPVTNGTGSEDYYNGAWGFDGKEFHYRHIGVPYVVNPFTIGGRWCLYRWHVDAPLAFEESIRFTIEHGTGNDRSDDFYSVAYWYQTEPHARQAARIFQVAQNRQRQFGITTIAAAVLPPFPAGFFKTGWGKPFSYLNGGQWDWFAARLLLAEFERGYSTLAYRQMTEVARKDVQAGGLYEWNTPDGEGKGANPYLSNAGALAKAVFEGLFGIKLSASALEIGIRLGNHPGRIELDQPATGTKVAYDYSYDANEKTIRLHYASNFSRPGPLEILLPKGEHARRLLRDGHNVEFRVKTVGEDTFVALVTDWLAHDLQLILN